MESRVHLIVFYRYLPTFCNYNEDWSYNETRNPNSHFNCGGVGDQFNYYR